MSNVLSRGVFLLAAILLLISGISCSGGSGNTAKVIRLAAGGKVVSFTR